MSLKPNNPGITERDCYHAIAINDLATVKAYLDIHGVDAPVENGTALHYAVFKNKEDIVSYLLEKGANVDLKYNDDVTPLIAAIDLGYINIAKLLVERKADVNMQDKKGNTPLSKAVLYYKGDTSLIEMLLHHGADPYKELVKNFTAKDLAKNMQLENVVKLLA